MIDWSAVTLTLVLSLANTAVALENSALQHLLQTAGAKELPTVTAATPRIPDEFAIGRFVRVQNQTGYATDGVIVDRQGDQVVLKAARRFAGEHEIGGDLRRFSIQELFSFHFPRPGEVYEYDGVTVFRGARFRVKDREGALYQGALVTLDASKIVFVDDADSRRRTVRTDSLDPSTFERVIQDGFRTAPQALTESDINLERYRKWTFGRRRPKDFNRPGTLWNISDPWGAGYLFRSGSFGELSPVVRNAFERLVAKGEETDGEVGLFLFLFDDGGTDEIWVAGDKTSVSFNRDIIDQLHEKTLARADRLVKVIAAHNHPLRHIAPHAHPAFSTSDIASQEDHSFREWSASERRPRGADFEYYVLPHGRFDGAQYRDLYYRLLHAQRQSDWYRLEYSPPPKPKEPEPL